MHFKQITVVGVGLLGGSLGLALQKRLPSTRVLGWVRRPASVKECMQLGVVHHATCDLAEAVHGSEAVVLCTPISSLIELGKTLAPMLQPGTLVTDVGSVKSVVVSELEGPFAKQGCCFVGSHPMAGAEKMGASG